MLLSRKSKGLICYLVCLVIGLLSSFVFVPAFAQIPFGSSSPTPAVSMNRPVWDLNRPRRCGRMYCSRVVFPVRILSQDNRLTLAYQAPVEMPAEEAGLNVEQRAQIVQFTVKFLKKRIASSWIKAEHLGQPLSSGIKPTYDPRFWWFRHEKPLHPLTPSLEIGFQNNSTVITIPKHPDFKISRQTIVTVTAPDALYAGIEIPQLAVEWKQIIENNLSESLWGMEFNNFFPGMRLILSLCILLVGGLGTLAFRYMRNSMIALNKRLLKAKHSISESVKDKMMAAYSGEVDSRLDDNFIADSKSMSQQLVSEKTALLPDDQCIEYKDQKLNLLEQRIFYRQGLVNQAQNIIELLLLFSNFLRIAFVLSILLSATAVFVSMRIIAFIVLQQSIVIPLICAAALVLRLLLVIIIDFNVNSWTRQAAKDDPGSKRYSLRAVTYSKVLKGGATAITLFLGLIFTLTALGVDRSLFTSAGVVAIAVGFLSRNILEDMIMGLLILAGDRFAIGDVVTIAGFGGFVENMDLFNTQLRGSDGQLTTLPNGQINSVENLTKDWSRVNFDIEVSVREDLRAVITLIREVAEDMMRDPKWSDSFLDVPEILGVDQVHSSGCLIRVWIKTQPMSQWRLGREFRLKIKEAFDQNGIKLGIPAQEVLLSMQSLSKD